ncbi:MAG: hypothetical protein IJR45_08420, partial [Firmicutes bacterium]|nr:hypothetical protein [Bacillota bacterium]
MFQNTKTKRRISVFLTFIMFMTSFFGIEAAASDDSYTLAFTCNNKQTSRSIGINETMALSSIMSDLDLSGTVTNAVSSDSTSITAAQSGSDWLLSPQKGFGSAIITVTTEESDEYTIAVSCYKISMNFTYSLMFRPNGGKGTMDSLSGPAGTSFVMPECTFTPPDGQRFKEWHIQAPNSTFNPDYSGHIRINAGETYVIDDFDHFVFPIWEDKENVHTLTASYNTEQGGVSLPSREGAGENVTVYVQPAFGYAADTVTYSDGTESKTAQKQDDGTWTFTMPNADTSVSIGFKQESSPSVDYIDENGTSHTVTSYQNVMPEHIEWTGGWYVLPQNLTISDRITVSGNAKLILTDGNTLTAESGIGIENNASLTVYSQSNGENMGALV